MIDSSNTPPGTSPFIFGLLISLTMMSQPAAAADQITRLGYHMGSSENVNDGNDWQSLNLSFQNTFRVEAPSAGDQSQKILVPKYRTSVSGGVLSTQTSSGLADIWLKGARLGQKRHLMHWWDLELKLKLPAADASKGLGTGATDLEIGIQALGSFGGWVPWYRLGYRVRGESDYYNTLNGWIAASGVGYQRWYGIYQFSEASQTGTSSKHWISLGRSFRLPTGSAFKSCSPYLSWSKGEYRRWGAGITTRF